MRAARKAAAAGILATFFGAMIEMEAAGPFGRVAWWRAPVTGAVAGAGVLVLGWACNELSPGEVEA
jgi:hypothetical protein